MKHMKFKKTHLIAFLLPVLLVAAFVVIKHQQNRDSNSGNRHIAGAFPREFYCEAIQENTGFVGLTAIASPLSPTKKWDVVVNYLEDHWNVPCQLQAPYLYCQWREEFARNANYQLKIDFTRIKSPGISDTFSRFFQGLFHIDKKDPVQILCYSRK